jgi:hypothetical protein
MWLPYGLPIIEFSAQYLDRITTVEASVHRGIQAHPRAGLAVYDVDHYMIFWKNPYWST